jgi:hypothetical protein
VADRCSRWFSSYAPVFGLLVLGVVLRLAGASAHWQWFDREHPSLWETSKLELSQDANQYIQQADPHTWASPLHRKWTERTYFRPPLASYYFVGLFRAVRFDRMLAASAQAGLAALAYLLLFLSVRRVFGRGIALGTLAVVALHPVLMFYDVSFEDSTLAFALLSATIYAALWARDGQAARWLVPGTAAGLAILARPNLLVAVAGVVFLAAAWSTKSRARVLIALLFPSVCLLTPVLWHNYSASKRLVPVADSAGQNLYWGNGELADYRVSIQGYWNILEVDRGGPVDLLTQGLKARTGKQFAEDAYRSAAIDFMAEHPVQALGRFLTKAWRHLSTYEIPRNTDFEILRQNVLVWRLPFVPFAAILVLALVGLRGIDRRPGVAVPSALAGRHLLRGGLLQRQPIPGTLRAVSCAPGSPRPLPWVPGRQKNIAGVHFWRARWLSFLRPWPDPLQCQPANARAMQPWTDSNQPCCSPMPKKMARGNASLRLDFSGSLVLLFGSTQTT